MLVSSGELHGGTHELHRFQNSFGASVVRHPYSYGGPQGLFELAVIAWDGANYDLCYDTEITSDVEGYLTAEAVQEFLARIEALEPRSDT